MRNRIVIVGSLIVIGLVWAAARSKPVPAPSPAATTDQSELQAPPLLVTAPAGQAITSGLEAGRNELELVRRPGHATRVRLASTAPVQKPGSTVEPMASALTALTPGTSSTMLAAPGAPAMTAPGSMPMPVALGAGGGQASGGDGEFRPRGPYGQTPGIIIRGGPGGVYDPCAKHGPNGTPIGIAINNQIPAAGGGVLINRRIPQRSSPRSVLRGGMR